jgi:hypothetical protein
LIVTVAPSGVLIWMSPPPAAPGSVGRADRRRAESDRPAIDEERRHRAEHDHRDDGADDDDGGVDAGLLGRAAHEDGQAGVDQVDRIERGEQAEPGERRQQAEDAAEKAGGAAVGDDLERGDQVLAAAEGRRQRVDDQAST